MRPGRSRACAHHRGSSGWDEAVPAHAAYRARRSIGPPVNSVEQALRRLALNDERSVRVLLSATPAPPGQLDAKGQALVLLGALLSVGAETVSLRSNVELALAAGATETEILAVLFAIGPAIGQARAVAAAPRLALALGYDTDED
jgi:4-carboxymuconolactone decarboxylase